MSELTDQHLLAAWAERRDEAAFRSLLGRYAGFVYGVTLRRTADAGLAEEISQDVFARLAQNAHRLMDHPTLAGWLHRSAMIITLDRLRRRTRHSQKLERFTQMNTQSGRDPWTDAAPHLDEALDRLATRDREVLMLHFIEQRTFPEIAARLGGSADAVRMRTNRALAELARLLGKRGTIIPAAALAAGLGTASAAPPSLLALAPAALAGAGKVSALSVIIHAFQTMKLSKAAALTALALVLVTPLIFQQQQIAAAEARIAALRNEQESRVALQVAEARVQPGPASKSGGIDLARLAADAIDGSYPASRRIRQAIERLDDNNLAGLIETVLQTKMLPVPREVLLQTLLDNMRKRDTALFLEWSMKAGAQMTEGSVRISDFVGVMRNKALDAFREWVAAQPERAAEWAEEHKEAWAVFTRDASGVEELTAAGFLLSSDPKSAFARMEKMSAQQCLSIYWSTWSSMDTSRKVEIAQWASKSPDVEKRRMLVAAAISSTSDAALDAAGELEQRGVILRGLGMDSADATWCALLLAMSSSHIVNDEVTKTPRVDVERVESILTWIETMVPTNDVAYARGALGHLFPASEALNFLNRELDQLHSDELIAGYVESEKIRWGGLVEITPVFIQRGETAFRVATRTVNPERRIKLLVRAWTDFHKQSPKAASEILDIPELSDSDRAAVEEQIAPLLKKKP